MSRLDTCEGIDDSEPAVLSGSILQGALGLTSQTRPSSAGEAARSGPGE